MSLYSDTTWFQELFGFREAWEGECAENYEKTKSQLNLSLDGQTICGTNGINYKTGQFDTPSLKSLRAAACALIESHPKAEDAESGTVKMQNVLGDVSVHIANNPNAVIQVSVTVAFSHMFFFKYKMADMILNLCRLPHNSTALNLHLLPSLLRTV